MASKKEETAAKTEPKADETAAVQDGGAETAEAKAETKAETKTETKTETKAASSKDGDKASLAKALGLKPGDADKKKGRETPADMIFAVAEKADHWSVVTVDGKKHRVAK